MRIFFGNFGEFFAVDLKISTYVSANVLWKYVFFEGVFSFLLLLSAFGQERDFQEKFAIFSKLYCACPKKLFREKNSSLRMSFFFIDIFLTLGDRFSEIWQTFVQQAFNFALHLPRRFCWRETRSLRKKRQMYKSLRILRERFLNLSRKLLAGLSKLYTTCPEEFLKVLQFFFDKKLFSLCFCCFSVKVPRDFGENFGQGYQNCSINVDGKFLRK